MKIKTQKQLDKYLTLNQKKINESKNLKEITEILKEQNQVLEDYIKYKCKELSKE